MNPLIYTVEATRLIHRMRSKLRTDPDAREAFSSDPGGYLDYIGALNTSPLPRVSQDIVARDVTATLFAENGWTLP
jgi:hypothetical protein